MDQEKIGRLIAKLRKLQGLTQTELGDKVGVGFKAVSKWERGITCPDISIINDLSKILGITADELLSGELKSETKYKVESKNKSNKNILIVILMLLVVIITIIFIIVINNNKTYSYILKSTSDDYYVEGSMLVNKNNINLLIDNLYFKNNEIANMLIDNYAYKIAINTYVLYANGSIDFVDLLDNPMTMEQLANNIIINYNDINPYKNIKDIGDNVTLNITALTVDNEIIEYDIEMLKILKENQ